MYTIAVKDLTKQHVSNADGFHLQQAIRERLATDEYVTLSFRGIPHLNTSYINTAFVELLGDFTLSEIQKRIKIIDSTRQINKLIKERLIFESNLDENDGH